MISPFARVEKQGGSLLLPKPLQSWGYGVLQPLGKGLARVGVTADTLTWLSLALGLLAGLALATGRFGVGAALLAASSTLDCLDGMVARLMETASPSGEVLDAAVDRFTEFFAFSGLVVFYRANIGLTVLALLALSGAYMVSYSTAKAEALGVPPPKSNMRRPERSFCLVLGTTIQALLPGSPERSFPVIAVLCLIALVGNGSAIRRLAITARQLRTLDEKRTRP